MKKRLHNYLLVCDRCTKSIAVVHTGAVVLPPNWTEVENLSSPDEPLDYCGECSEGLKKALEGGIL